MPYYITHHITEQSAQKSKIRPILLLELSVSDYLTIMITPRLL